MPLAKNVYIYICTIISILFKVIFKEKLGKWVLNLVRCLIDSFYCSAYFKVCHFTSMKNIKRKNNAWPTFYSTAAFESYAEMRFSADHNSVT